MPFGAREGYANLAIHDVPGEDDAYQINTDDLTMEEYNFAFFVESNDESFGQEDQGEAAAAMMAYGRDPQRQDDNNYKGESNLTIQKFFASRGEILISNSS